MQIAPRQPDASEPAHPNSVDVAAVAEAANTPPVLGLGTARFIQLALEEILAIWHKYSSRLRRGEILRPRGLPKILLTPMDYCTGLLRLWNRWAQGPMFNTYIDNRGI